MHSMLIIIFSILLLSSCTKEAINTCEQHSGVVLKHGSRQLSFLQHRPDFKSVLHDTTAFKAKLREEKFFFQNERLAHIGPPRRHYTTAPSIFQCPVLGEIDVDSSELIYVKAEKDYGEAYIIGYDEDGQLIMIINRFSYTFL